MVKKNKTSRMIQLLSFASFLLILISSARAGFSATVNDPLKLSVGARSIGMGKATLAATGDINSLFINPGGLASLGNFQMTATQANFLGEYSYTLLGCGLPTPIGNLALGFAKSEAGGIIRTVYVNGRIEPDPSGEVLGGSDNVFLLGLGKKISWLGKDWQLGARFKFYQQFLAEYSRQGWGLDGGLIINEVFPDVDLALMAQNILPPRLTWPHLGSTQTIYPVLSAGVAWHLWQDKVIVGAQIDKTFPRGPFQLNLGLEWWLSPEISLRFGSNDNFGNLTLGVGLWTGGVAGQTYSKPQKQDWQFDYAFQRLPVDLFPSGGHFFSLTYLGQSGQAKTPPGAPAPSPEPSPLPTAASSEPQPAVEEKPPAFYQTETPQVESKTTNFYGVEVAPAETPAQPESQPQEQTTGTGQPSSQKTKTPRGALKVTTSPAQEVE